MYIFLLQIYILYINLRYKFVYISREVNWIYQDHLKWLIEKKIGKKTTKTYKWGLM